MLCAVMITRNEHLELARCLDSAAGIMDHIFIMDGCSTDGTIDYLNSRPDKDKIHVYQYPWDYGNPRMFMQQRNRLLDKVDEFLKNDFNQNPWLFMLDSDETLSTGLHAFLRERKYMDSSNNKLGYWISRLNLTSGVGFAVYPGILNPQDVSSEQAKNDFIVEHPDWQLRLIKYDGTQRYDSPPHETFNARERYPEKLEFVHPSAYFIHQKFNPADSNHDYFTAIQEAIDHNKPVRAFSHRGISVMTGIYTNQSDLSAVIEAEKINGWMTRDELLWLSDKASSSNIIIEVGAFEGRSTKVLARPGKKVYVIDPWFGNRYDPNTHSWVMDPNTESSEDFFRKNLAEEINNGTIHVLKMTSEKAVSWLKKKNIIADMVFLDGDHSDPVISHDVKNYFQFVREGGMYCGHDLNPDFPDVENALKTYMQGYARANYGQIWFRVK